MAKHIVIGGPIEHNGKLYTVGDEIDLSGDNARQLLDLAEVLTLPEFKERQKADQKAAGEQG